MPTPRKNPAAVALGKLAKGKPKTMTPAAKQARKANAIKGAIRRAYKRMAMAQHVKAIALHAKDLDPVPPGPAVPWDDDED